MSINWRTVAVAAVAAALAGTATSVVSVRAQSPAQTAANGLIVAAPATNSNKPYAWIVTAEGDVFQVEDNNSVQYRGNLQAVKAKATK